MNKSFSLIEVLIFVSVTSVFFVIAAAASATLIRQMKVNEHKIVATRSAEELLSWIRSEKERDWIAFASNDVTEDGSSTEYCMNELMWGVGGAICQYEHHKIFRRTVALTTTGRPPNKVNVDINVSWNEGGRLYNIPIRTVVTIFE